jgi:hypothetical protein
MYKDIFNISIVILFIITVYLIYDNYNDKTLSLRNYYKPKLIKFITTKLNDNNKKLFLIPFFELGDNILMNGAVRYYCTKYTKVVLVCKDMYYDQISYMYQDLTNLLLYKIPTLYSNQYLHYYIPKDNDIDNLFKYYNIQYFHIADNYINYDQLLNYHYTIRTYRALNLNLDIGYKYFKINRDLNKENEIYNKLVNLIGSKYVIIIDDEKRNFKINNMYIKDIKYPIFKLGLNSKNVNPKLDLIKDPYIFNYITILENAVKILSIDSSIPWLCDYANLDCNLYIYNTRQGKIEYRNKNIKLLEVEYKDEIKSLYNSNNYIYKYPYEYLTSILPSNS